MKYIFSLVMMSLLGPGMLAPVPASGSIAIERTSQQASPSQRSVDLAVGIVDAGELKHTVYNNGLLGTWGWAGYTVPELPAGWFKGYGYIPDFNFWIGIPEGPWNPEGIVGPTVSEAQLYGGTNRADWDPTPGSLGRYHSGDVAVGDLIPGAPLSDVPIMATSTIRESWPENQGGERFWPGPWAVDPGPDGVARTEDDSILVGHFTGDKEDFFSFTDDPFVSRDELVDQGFPIGAQVDAWVISYGRSYAEDFLFFPCTIINNSDWHYSGVYVAFYVDVDVEEYDEEGVICDREDWMDFITREWEVEVGDTVDYDMAYVFDYRPEPNWRPYVGVKLLETSTDSDGAQLGLTDWHWFEWENRPGVVITDRQERIQYKVMSGDNTDIRPEEDAAYFHPDAEGILDPHFDSAENIQRLYPHGTDCVFLMSSGPFEWAPHETTAFSFCLIMGDDREDLKRNARTAQLMYDLNYIGASPPPSPEVRAVPGDGCVTLYWNESAEKARDMLTGYADFEGYKIYRTTSDPVQREWGMAIRDGYGNVVGYLPVAQFDVRDGIKGLDPEYPHLNLGDDSGLRHSWTDVYVENGRTYWYSVTAYDRGAVEGDTVNNPDGWPSLNSLECALGSSPWCVFRPEGSQRLIGSSNLVMVIPGQKPPDWEDPVVPETPEPMPGTLGNGSIRIDVIDPYVVTGHIYIISFDDSSQHGTLLFDVLDETIGQYVLRGREEINTESTRILVEGPIFDGVRISITGWDEVAFWPDSSYIVLGDQTDTTNMTFAMEPFVPRPADYRIVFTEEGDTSFNGVVVPFEAWNTTENTRPRFEVLEDFSTGDKVWQDGEPVRLWEGTFPTWIITIFARPDTISLDSIEVICCPPETIFHYTFGDTLPLHVGDEIVITTKRPFVGGDRYVLETVGMTTGVEEDGSVRSVPESYSLRQNYPNPFNTSTTIEFHIPRSSSVSLDVFNILGQRIRTLVNGDCEAGDYSLQWDGRDGRGLGVATGVYFYRLQAGDFVETKRMLFLK